MKKIISLFKRDYEKTHLVYNEVVTGAEWVTNGEGVATRKYDGTCCLVRNGKLFKRYELKPGKDAPKDFEPANDVDTVTGKQQGWLPVTDCPDDKYHLQAFKGHELDGTYELCGPAIQGNPEGYSEHILVSHETAEQYPNFPRDFEGIKDALSAMEIEGVVWHHQDGRMVKIKKKDFFKK